MEHSIDDVIERLETGMDVLERGGETEADTLGDLWNVYNHARKVAAPGKIEITPEVRSEAAARADLFKAEMASMRPEEMKTRLADARARNDVSELYLFSVYCPNPEIKYSALSNPGDASVREKLARVDHMLTEMRLLRQIPAPERARRAFIRGMQPASRPGEPEASTEVDHHRELLKKTGQYTF